VRTARQGAKGGRKKEVRDFTSTRIKRRDAIRAFTRREGIGDLDFWRSNDDHRSLRGKVPARDTLTRKRTGGCEVAGYERSAARFSRGSFQEFMSAARDIIARVTTAGNRRMKAGVQASKMYLPASLTRDTTTESS